MDQVDLGKMDCSDLEDKIDYYISISSCDIQKGLMKDIKSNFDIFFNAKQLELLGVNDE